MCRLEAAGMVSRHESAGVALAAPRELQCRIVSSPAGDYALGAYLAVTAVKFMQ